MNFECLSNTRQSQMVMVETCKTKLKNILPGRRRLKTCRGTKIEICWQQWQGSMTRSIQKQPPYSKYKWSPNPQTQPYLQKARQPIEEQKIQGIRWTAAPLKLTYNRAVIFVLVPVASNWWQQTAKQSVNLSVSNSTWSRLSYCIIM